jgi:hypothetical protein
MIQDALLVFSDEQAQTSLGAHDSSSTLDLQTANVNIGQGTPIYFIWRVNTTFTSSSSATFTMKLQDSSDGTTWVDTGIGPFTALAYSLFTKGKVYSYSLPPNVQRYLKVVNTIAVAVLSAGAWDSWLGLEQPKPA